MWPSSFKKPVCSVCGELLYIQIHRRQTTMMLTVYAVFRAKCFKVRMVGMVMDTDPV